MTLKLTNNLDTRKWL